MDGTAAVGAVQRVVTVVENRAVARDTYRLRLDDPGTAQSIRPGQFLMIRPGGENDPLLGRPLALYDVVRDASGTAVGVDVVYLVIGRGTRELARRRPGDQLALWGPLGNGFGPPPQAEKSAGGDGGAAGGEGGNGGEVFFVAGGIGQTPFLALGKWWLGRESFGGLSYDHASVRSATLLYGVRTGSLAAGVEDFERAGIAVELATDDGSAGHRGYVTDMLRRRLDAGRRPDKVVGCGPAPMLSALAKIAAEFKVDCDVSLENHMACGYGVCFSCVAPIVQSDGSTDLRRVCIEGPVFAAAAVDWTC